MSTPNATNHQERTAIPPCSEAFFQHRAEELVQIKMPRAKIHKMLLRENRDCANPPSEEKIYRDIKRAIDDEKVKEATKKIQAERERKRAAQAQAKPVLKPMPVQSPDERATMWAEIEKFFKKHFLNPDVEAVKITYAIVASHVISEFSPSWLMNIAPPGTIKTGIFNALDGLPRIHLIDEVTANTFISGKSDEPGQVRTTPASLLHRIGEDGIVIIADFSTVLEMDEKTRGKILSQLRRIYDGQLRREFGTNENLEEREWKGHITLLAGATPEAERYHKVFAALGDRFVRTRWDRAGGAEAAQMALTQGKTVHADLKKLVHNFMRPILSHKQIQAPRFPTEFVDRLANFSEFITLSRGYVPRSSSGDREITGLPEIESNTRLPQELSQLGRGAAVLMNRPEVTEEDFALVIRAGWDTVPRVRRSILESLLAGKKPHTAGLPPSTTDRELENLVALGLVEKDVFNWGPGWEVHRRPQEDQGAGPGDA